MLANSAAYLFTMPSMPPSARSRMLCRSSVVPAMLPDPSPNRKYSRGARLSLLRYRRARGSQHGNHWSRLIDQGFNDDGCHPGVLHIERVGSTRREVDDPCASVWAAVVDLDDHRTAVVE